MKMGYVHCSGEESRLQRKLIPLNIVVAVIALIAAVSLIFTPALKIDVGKMLSAMTEVTAEVTDGYALHSAVDGVIVGGSDGNAGGESGEGSGDTESGGNTEGGDNGGEGSGDSGSGNGGDNSGNGSSGGFDMNKVMPVVGNIAGGEIVLTPVGSAKVLFAPADERALMLMDDLLISSGLLNDLLVLSVNVTLVSATEAIPDDELINIDYDKLNEALLKADNAKSAEEFNAVISDYINVMEEQMNGNLDAGVKDAVKEQCAELYNDTVAQTGGSFSVESMICVFVSGESETPATSYRELAESMVAGNESFDAVNQIAPYYGLLFIFMLYCALMWFILFLFAFFRIFAPNKRFTMWYVKFAGCWPCIIFFLLPLLISRYAGGEMTAATAVFCAMSSFTWISGVCYLLLWAVSIFWAFIIKHKIRKIRKG